MRVIFVMSDSFRWDHLGYLGNKWIRTPNLDRLSKECAVFENSVAGSWATVPNRTDLLIGQYGFRERPWQPLKPDDITLPMDLAERGIRSQLISDTANTISRECNLYRGFSAWFHNRGQEGDPWCTRTDVPLDLKCPLEGVRYPAERWHQILMNRAHRQVESDWFAPGTFTLAINWLKQNRKLEKFLLWIDTFDPHEPWDPPQHYIDLYDPNYEGRVFEAPTYGIRKKIGMTDRELKHTRARYAGECTMVDHWVGQLAVTMEQLGMLDDTMLIFTADHGHYLDYPGDGGLIGKPSATGPEGTWKASKDPKENTYHPLYLTMARQPLLLRMPGRKKGKRITAFVQPADIMPTILDFFGMKKPDRCQGESLLPLIAGKKKTIRPSAYSGLHKRMSLVTNKRWAYCCWLGMRPAALWDRKADPDQKKDVAKKHPDVVKEMHKELATFLRSVGAAEAYITAHDPQM
ncbi:MAG: sulfatase [Planctomycetota bacterium]